MYGLRKHNPQRTWSYYQEVNLHEPKGQTHYYSWLETHSPNSVLDREFRERELEKNKHWCYWSIRPSWCWWNIYHQVAKYTFIFICVIFTKQDHVWASNISPQIQETKTCSKDYNSQTLAEWNQRWPIGRGRGRIIAAVRDTLTSVI